MTDRSSHGLFPAKNTPPVDTPIAHPGVLQPSASASSFSISITLHYPGMTAPRLTLDPYLDIRPDFSDAAFQSTRDLMVADAAQGTPITDAEAAAQMATGWTTALDARKLIWDAQVQADATQAAA
ncbi:hypothetical protein B0H13DRAFT_2394335 [Mycena leptocephala]|nr:hypothetical protein B0H13DRAFT_2394335 [Mycena leptocephala]